jgi:hypothetical protein
MATSLEGSARPNSAPDLVSFPTPYPPYNNNAFSDYQVPPAGVDPRPISVGGYREAPGREPSSSSPQPPWAVPQPFNRIPTGDPRTLTRSPIPYVPERRYDVRAPPVFRPEHIPFAPIDPPHKPGQPPTLTASRPTIDSLLAAAQSVAAVDNLTRKVVWSKQVLNLVDRTQALELQLYPKQDASFSQISNPQLVQLVDQAISFILMVCEIPITTSQVPLFLPEALYLRGTLAASGSFPTYVARDPRTAFKDFETATRYGFHAAWFKIGREYERVNDSRRAKECFQRGVGKGDKNCLYVSFRSPVFLYYHTDLRDPL